MSAEDGRIIGVGNPHTWCLMCGVGGNTPGATGSAQLQTKCQLPSLSKPHLSRHSLIPPLMTASYLAGAKGTVRKSLTLPPRRGRPLPSP